jgi:hypothetical protein
LPLALVFSGQERIHGLLDALRDVRNQMDIFREGPFLINAEDSSVLLSPE